MKPGLRDRGCRDPGNPGRGARSVRRSPPIGFSDDAWPESHSAATCDGNSLAASSQNADRLPGGGAVVPLPVWRRMSICLQSYGSDLRRPDRSVELRLSTCHSRGTSQPGAGRRFHPAGHRRQRGYLPSILRLACRRTSSPANPISRLAANRRHACEPSRGARSRWTRCRRCFACCPGFCGRMANP